MPIFTNRMKRSFRIAGRVWCYKRVGQNHKNTIQSGQHLLLFISPACWAMYSIGHRDHLTSVLAEHSTVLSQMNMNSGLEGQTSYYFTNCIRSVIRLCRLMYNQSSRSNIIYSSRLPLIVVHKLRFK